MIAVLNFFKYYFLFILAKIETYFTNINILLLCIQSSIHNDTSQITVTYVAR